MEEIIGSFRLEAPLSNKNAGFSRWTSAVNNGKRFFLKEFLNPIYPLDTAGMPESLINGRRQECMEFQKKKSELYNAIRHASNGNIVQIESFFRHKSHYYIATEFLSGETVPFKDLQLVSYDDRRLICCVLAYSVLRLHNEHVVHADIKESNVMLVRSSTGKLIPKLFDFDCSFLETEPPEDEDDLACDQVYMAPEAYDFLCGEETKLSCKLDVFSLGILFHQYLTGMMPRFDTAEYDYAYAAVMDGKELQVLETLPDDMRELLQGMLKADPAERFDMAEVYSRLQKRAAPKPVPAPEPVPAAPAVPTSFFFAPGDL